MNRIEISGIIQTGPHFKTGESGFEVAHCVLCCGSSEKVIPVVATKTVITELRQFQNGDSICVEGVVIWPQGKPEILAERIRPWTNSVYDPEKREPIRPPREAEWHRVNPFKADNKAGKRHW